jgi:hypothetical protein
MDWETKAWSIKYLIKKLKGEVGWLVSEYI